MNKFFKTSALIVMCAGVAMTSSVNVFAEEILQSKNETINGIENTEVSDEALLNEASQYAEQRDDNFEEMTELEEHPEAEPTNYIPVLMYHHFVEGEFKAGDGATMSIDEFEEQLKTFNELGYKPIFADELYDKIVHNEFEEGFGEKYICLTVDDGYRSNYDLMYPLVKKYDTKISLSVIASRIHVSSVVVPEIPKLMWKELNEMQESGHVKIYNHSLNHKMTSEILSSEFEHSVLDAEALIDKNLDQRWGRVFTYPNGVYDFLTTTKVRQMGYDIQLTTDFGVVTKDTSINKIPRITVDSGMSGEDVIEKIEAAAKRTFVKE